jgi:endonuclease/exonuclease/phosphatase family metal-dependent hydrolase
MDDSKDMCNQLERIIIKHVKIVIVGDFNMPSAQWSSTSAATSGPCGLLQQLASGHDLAQIACQPTRESSLLDLIFVSSHFVNSCITNLAPVGDSDHARSYCTCPSLHE